MNDRLKNYSGGPPDWFPAAVFVAVMAALSVAVSLVGSWWIRG
jgi:hypothetical protein